MSNLTLNYINKINNNPVDRGYHWVESWLFSTNAKQIGLLYGIFALFSGLVGLSLSVLMRIELASPNPQILMGNGQLWNVLVTAHALFMVFFLVMPVTMGALGNYLVPLMIGTSDTAFPRINNIAFWLLVPSMLFGVLSCLIDEGPGTGWTLMIWGIKMSFDAWKTKWIKLYLKILNYFKKLLFKVTIFNIIGQYASFNNNKLQRLNMTKLLIKKGFKTSKPNSLNIYEYIIGIIDANGSFNININKLNKKIKFTLKITLLEENRQLLYKLKKYLKFGKLKNDNNLSHYIITDTKVLLNNILPILDKYPLLTSKKWNYLKFKECLLISTNNKLNEKEKILKIEEIKNNINEINNNKINTIKSMNKSWLIGFIEVKGNFNIENSKYIFRIISEPEILLNIRLLLGIIGKIRNNKGKEYVLDSMDRDEIIKIINYLTYKDKKSYLSGIKSYEFSIWKKLFIKKNKSII